MKKIIIISFIVIAFALCFLLYYYNIIPNAYDKKYSYLNTYKSNVDKDLDGVDDQTDILNEAKKYLEASPKYKSKYYESGYPNDNYGVCTDIVTFALRGAGYDLMKLVNEDILANRELYDIKEVDIRIDFRRVKNLLVYFKRYSICLNLDTSLINEWQPGDIVVFNGHIGIISDKRNLNGIPFVLHHYSKMQVNYEEDILNRFGKILGHFRVS